MSQSSLAVLNGIHKIYQRLLSQIPKAVSKTLDLRSIRAGFSVTENELIASTTVRGQTYSLTIAKLTDKKEFLWAPHPDLADKNEGTAICEMLREFKENHNAFNFSPGARRHALRTSCQAFFSKIYR